MNDHLPRMPERANSSSSILMGDNRFFPELPTVRLLIFVEGANDIEFLKRISRLIHLADPLLPDLTSAESEKKVLFLPIGGSEQRIWIGRLSPLHVPEFHLFDRDVPPSTELRHAAVNAVNMLPNCRAAMTGLRALENYLHPAAIFEARGLTVSFTGEDDVPIIVAQESYVRTGGQQNWLEIPSRHRKRFSYQAKRWLNTEAADRMTFQRLEQQDPSGDVRSWLKTIAGYLK